MQGRHVYEGTIAGKPVLLRIRCAQQHCSGSYVYESIGELLRLDGDGRDFDETIGAGKRTRVTGRLAFDGPPGAPLWSGRWTAEAGPAQPIDLKRVVTGQVPRVIKRTFADRIGKDECHVRIRSIELSGLADEALEDRINALLAPEQRALEHAIPSDQPAGDMCGPGGTQCGVSARGYRILCRDHSGRTGLELEDEVRVTLLDDKLLSVRSEYYFDGGGAHPSDGVRGLTVDLRTGHALDGRDLLTKPEREPAWSSFLPATSGDDEDARIAPLALGRVARDEIAEPSAWGDFYLTPSGIELVPNVPEAARIYRHRIQHVPFRKVRSALRAEGPAAHLYTR